MIFFSYFDLMSYYMNSPCDCAQYKEEEYQNPYLTFEWPMKGSKNLPELPDMYTPKLTFNLRILPLSKT